jgi:hypothetical protein
MEYTREQYFTYYRDTNKHTTDRKFESLTALLDYLSNEDEGDETEDAVVEWLRARGRMVT